MWSQRAILASVAPFAALAVFAIVAWAAPQSGSGVLIKGGQLIDGTGAPARRADVRIRGDQIAEVADALQPAGGERVIEASGKVVAPGFVDTHSHADRGIEQQPDAGTQVLQGITTAIVGQDGGGRLPVSDFYESIERLHSAINYATAVGHGTVRGLVMGGDFKRAATPQEVDVMGALVDRAMRDGAVGLTSGLEYDPGFYAKPEELQRLATFAARHGGYYASHVRDEENDVFAAWREAIDVGRVAHLPVQISHIKLASKAVWGKAPEALRLLEDARRDGVRVTADWYPYTYWQSSIYVLIPDRDFENRRKWEVGLEEIGGAQNVLVTGYAPDASSNGKSYNGKTIDELAKARGTDPVTLIIEMIRASGPGIGIIGTSMDERDLAAFAADPHVLICSDGSLQGSHPRGYGAFPRVLAKYVRELHALSLPQAIAKMTGASAALAGISDRGVIAAGKKADLVIFDPQTIQDRGTPREPAHAPAGMHYVIVNGQLVLDEGRMTTARPGRALRRQAR